MKRASVNCPKCRYTYHDAVGKMPRYYGDPHTTCPKCGAPFLDPWTIELALYPRNWYKTHHRRIGVFAAITAAMFLAGAALFHFGADFIENSRYGGVAVLSILVVWIAAIALYSVNSTRISINETGFDRMYEESAKRLADPMYKHALIDSGYYKQAVRHIKE